MAKIIRDTKEVTDYYEDYRIAGYSTHIAEAYYCGNCKKEIKEEDLLRVINDIDKEIRYLNSVLLGIGALIVTSIIIMFITFNKAFTITSFITVIVFVTKLFKLRDLKLKKSVGLEMIEELKNKL